MRPPMAILLVRLGEEMGRWAAESERLETVVGQVAARAAPTPDETLALQALDGLTQHLRAVSAILVGAGTEAEAGVGDGDDTANRLCLVLRDTGLAALTHRLSGTEVVPESRMAGEVELW